MKNRWLASIAIGALCLAPAASHAVVSQIYGTPTSPICDDATRVNEQTANVWMFHSGSISDGDDIIFSTRGGAYKRGAPSITNGTVFFLGSNFVPAPGATETVWIVATTMDPANLNAHQGFMTVDHIVATQQQGHAAVLQPLDFQSRPTPYDDDNPSQGLGGGGTITGFDLRLSPIGEFDATGSVTNPVDATPPRCFAGSVNTPAWSSRVIAGYNVYRLDATTTPPGSSTALTYLRGPDGNFLTRADNGWVGFVSLNPTGGAIDLDAGTDLRTGATSDLFGIEAGSIIFSDALRLPAAAGGGPNPLAPNITRSYTYVFQPVVRVTVANLTAFAVTAPGTMTDGDGNGTVDTVDVNGDGSPEFIDPSGTGLGLVYQGADGISYPLMASDSATTASQDLPAAGELEFGASFNNGMFNLSFTMSAENNIAGYNIYRSAGPNDSSSFVRVNQSLIVAKGAPLSIYGYQDSIPQTRRMARGVYYYKVEAVSLDGSRRTFGPYEAAFTGTASPRGR